MTSDSTSALSWTRVPSFSFAWSSRDAKRISSERFSGLKCSFQLYVAFGFVKYSISICSNSRSRKRKSLGLISFLNAFPTCAIPKGSLTLLVSVMFLKLAKMIWAVSPRRNPGCALCSDAPRDTGNMRLNVVIFVSGLPFGLVMLLASMSFSSSSELKPSVAIPRASSTRWSARYWSPVFASWMIGSLKLAVWPEASQIFAELMMAPSIPTISSRVVTKRVHQWLMMARLSSTPRGP